MPLLRTVGRSLLPTSRAAAALWAWRNRQPLVEWGRFGVTAAPRVLGGDRADVAAEAKLRAALTADPATRAAPGLRLEVRNGVATLSGTVDRDVAERGKAKADNVGAVTKVKDDTKAPSRRPRRS